MSGGPQHGDGDRGADSSARKLAVRFRDLDGLKRQLEGAIRKNLILVPDRNPSPAGTAVELTISLPECHRLIYVAGHVDRVMQAAGDRPPAMLLRFDESAAGLPSMLDKFIHGCKGVRCRQLEQSLGAFPECDLSPDGRADHVIKRPTSEMEQVPLRPAGSTATRRTRPPSGVVPVARVRPVDRSRPPSGAMPKVNPDLLDPNKRSTLVGMQSAPGRAGFAPSMPPPPGSEIVPEDEAKAKKKKGPHKKKRPSLLNLPIFGRKKQEEEEEKKDKPAASGPRLSGEAADKAASILHQARQLIANKEEGKALGLLRMALAFDPDNSEAKMLLQETEATYKPTFGK